MHRREASTGSMRASRSPPFDHTISGEPPGFSGVIPESPNTAAPRSSSVGGGIPRETSSGQVIGFSVEGEIVTIKYTGNLGENERLPTTRNYCRKSRLILFTLQRFIF